MSNQTENYRESRRGGFEAVSMNQKLEEVMFYTTNQFEFSLFASLIRSFLFRSLEPSLEVPITVSL